TCLVGIINAMLMSVTERIKEIGTLKCLGAQDAFIVKTFFIEASLQGVMGTVLGVVLGLLVGLLVNTFAYGRFVWSAFPAFLVVKSVVVSLVVGSLMSVAAAIAPAYWAARKQPVEAMRVEE
ncbi:MAG: FtsX-like permease family protein, partial [Chloroflexi bacterium]|nr:FtsX-like permease family protein [Chloroflexota bacterium]